jgi:signal transduction histidine kinase
MSKLLKPKDPSFAVLCSRAGLITQVLHDGLGLREAIVPGVVFISILRPGSVEKGRKFLKSVQANRGLDGWQMDVRANRGFYRLYFAGVPEGDQFAIIGVPAPLPVAVTGFLRELLAGKNSGDVAEIAVRALLNEKNDLELDAVYGQLIRLNDELVSEQRDLIGKNLDLARRLEADAVLLRAATHDLRQQVGAILVCSELLLEEALSTMAAENLELVNSIHASSEFMLRLLDDITALSAAEAEVLQHVESASIVEIIRHSFLLSRSVAERKQAKLVLRQKGAVPSVQADAPKLARVFHSLIEYVIEHSHSNTEIEVQVALKHMTALVSVRVEGAGIARDEIQDVFARSPKKRTRVAAGELSTVLKLAIAKRIVESHGGQIEMRVGRNVAFYVSLQATSDPPRHAFLKNLATH